MKIKSRKLLTIILTLLFALSLAFGIGFVMPDIAMNIVHADVKDEKNLLAQIAGYDDFSDMCDDITNNGTTLTSSKFGSATVTFGGMEWWPVLVNESNGEVIITLWLKTSVGNYTFSDGTYGRNDTYPSNDYSLSWIRAALNAGQTDLGYYYGSWPNNTLTNEPEQYQNYEKSDAAVCAPTEFLYFKEFIDGAYSKYVVEGETGDKVWLPLSSEVQNGGIWECKSTQWAGSKVDSWTRTPGTSPYSSCYRLNAVKGTALNSLVSNGSYSVRPAIKVNLSAVDEIYVTPDKPVADTSTFTYNGEEQTYLPRGFDDGTMNIVDNVQTNAGVYTVTVTRKSGSWTDGTTGALTFTFIINPKSLQINWATQSHFEGSGVDGFYFMLPSLNVSLEVQQFLTDVKYYLKADYNTATGTAIGEPVTKIEEGKDYYAVVEINEEIAKGNYEISGENYCAFNTTDGRTAVAVTIENSGETYDGNQHGATAKAVTADGATLVIGEDIDFLLTYYKADDSVYEKGSTVAPTNAGTYKLVVAIKPTFNEDYKPSDTMEFEYVIKKADPVCNPVVKDDGSLTDGDNLPTISSGLSDTSGTYSWDAGQKAVVGENYYTYMFIPTDTVNYNTVSGKFKLTAAASVDNNDPNNPGGSGTDTDDPNNPGGGTTDPSDPNNPGGGGTDTDDPNNPGGGTDTDDPNTPGGGTDVNDSIIPLPDLSQVSYTGNVIDILQGWNYKDYVTVTGNTATDAGTYPITLTIKDPDLYRWANAGATVAKSLAKYGLTNIEVNGATVTADWTIAPAVLKGTWNEYGTLDITSESYKGSTDGLFAYKYFDKDGNEVTTLVVGETYTATAELLDNKNFVLDTDTAELLEEEHEFVAQEKPVSGIAAVWNKVKEFMSKTFLGLPLWSWLLIGLALLILLIIIIVVIAKRSKKKDDEKKSQKQEEQVRKEVTPQPQIAGIAGLAGMAGMALPQPQIVQALPAQDNSAILRLEAELAEMRAKLAAAQPVQIQQTPAQQALPVQQPLIQQATSQDNSAILRLEMELAEMRAKLAAVQQPVQQVPVQYQSGSVLEERLRAAEERARYAEERMSRSEEERARQAEERALRAAEERARLAEEQNLRNAYLPHSAAVPTSSNGSISLDALGALAIAALRNIAVKDQPAPVIPQNVEESTQSGHAQYPSDAVITTTTTVDTTQKQPRGIKRETKVENSGFDDFDGFYENYKE